MTCEKCGETIDVGDWPFCPHGATGNYKNFRDAIPGGVTVENYGPNPVTFYSHSERRAYMKAHGLEERGSFAPMPGTDVDPQGIPNPRGYMDAQTLENGRILLTRQSGGEDFDPIASGLLKLLDTEILDSREAIDVSLGRK